MSVLLHGVEHLSPSGASTLVDCPRKFWWRYAHGLGRDERTEPLAMGGGFAAALEFGDLDLGLAEYRKRRPIEDGWTDPAVHLREGWAGESTIYHAYHGYVERFADPGLVREQTYFIAIPGQERLIQARVDGCVPGQYLVEDKLRSASSMRADATENEVRQGRQLTAEVYAHWKATGDLLPVKLRPTKKCDPRKWKKLDDRSEVDAVIAEHFAGDGVFNEFDAPRTLDQLAEFEREFSDLIVSADRLLASDTPAGVRNQDAFHQYGRTCPALAVCQGMRDWQELVA